MAKQPDRPNDIADASPVDGHTHAELRMLYAESTETMRFVKNHQWKTVGATLLTFLGLIFVAGFIEADGATTNKFMAIVLVLTCAVIFTLIIYQFWMHNEARKIEKIEAHLSTLFADVRAVKSRREGNLHRYTLLSFMIIVVIMGTMVVSMAFDQLARAPF